MISQLKSAKREHKRHPSHRAWRTLFPQGLKPFAGAEGTLIDLLEVWLPPGESMGSATEKGVETVTYVYQGVLCQKSSRGSSVFLHAGEFQRLATDRLIHHQESNATQSDWTYIFKLALRDPEILLGSPSELRHFTSAQRHNNLCAVASPTGGAGSLRIRPDVRIYSSVLDSEQLIVHELEADRSAWLHIVRGSVALNGSVLGQGDGAGFTDEPEVSLTAREASEVLLIDVCATPVIAADTLRFTQRPTGKSESTRSKEGPLQHALRDHPSPGQLH